MRFITPVLTLALATPLAGCGAIGEMLMPDLYTGYYRAIDPPSSRTTAAAEPGADPLASALASVGAELVEVAPGTRPTAALLDALAARSLSYRLLAERVADGDSLQALLVRADAALELQDSAAQAFQAQAAGDAQAYLRADVAGPSGSRRVVSVMLASDPLIRRAQLEVLTVGPAAIEGSIVLLGLPADLGASEPVLRSAGFEPPGTPVAAWARGPLPQPSVETPPDPAIGQLFTLVR